MKIYDLVIIGAGPAGIIAAKTVVSKGFSVLLIEKGQDLYHRRDLISGWFGQGLYAMNRLDLEDPVLNNSRITKEIFKLIQRISSRHHMTIYKENGKEKLCMLPNKIGIEFATYLFDSLVNKADIAFNTEAKDVYKDDDIFVISTTKKVFKGKRCLIATGKNSIKWVEDICKKLSISVQSNGVKLGVRVEIPTFRAERVIQDGEVKIQNKNTTTEDTRVNAFVGEWEESNILSAFGHALIDKMSRRTNFMVGFEAKTTINDAIRNVQIINILANDRLKKERIEDFLAGKTILKHIRMFDVLKETFIEAEKDLPLFTNYAVMYVPEIRFKGVLHVDDFMKTKISGLYGVGECTSRVSTLIGAMASGLIAGRTILKE